MSAARERSDVPMTRDEALAWIADVFNEPVSAVRTDARRIDLLGWDSLGHLVLISALDQQFGIKLSQKELPSLTTVQRILDLLASHERLVNP
jgi:acyl carrier protein